MKKLLLLIILFIPVITFAQKPAVIKITHLEERLAKGGDTTFIVNFWATWCKPCVEELPDFERVTKEYGSKKVKVLLVSMDFPEHLDKQVIPFIKKKDLKSEVVLLDEVNGNYFIPKVDSTWTGAIPATLIRNKAKGVREFYEKKINYQVLDACLRGIEEQ